MDFSTLKFLIIDDAAAARQAMRITLDTFGVKHTTFAVNGTDAVRRLADHHFDVILCDYLLGEGKDGQQVLEEVRHRNLVPRSTIFFMITAERVYQRVISAVELAPDDYLIKPFSGETLRRRLERAIIKKEQFKRVYELIDAEDFTAAVLECERNINEKSKHAIDFIRLKAELCLMTNNAEEAQKMYELVIATRAVPWATLGLGKALYQQKDYEGAERQFLSLTQESDEFVQAFDWLSRTYEAMGNTHKAQDIIAKAIDISPNVILRQKRLGTIAYLNQDLDTAEKAFKQSIDLGKFSIHKSPDEYVGLSKSLLSKGNPSKALEIARSVNKEFPDDPTAKLQAVTTESVIHKVAGNEQAAHEAFEQAMKLFDSIKNDVPGEVAVSMAETCLHFGKEDAADEIIRTVAMTSHDNDDLIKKASGIYKTFGLEERGAKTIQEGSDEAVRLNNDAVMLAREGKLDEAITLLREAADNGSASITVVLNAAHAMLMYIEKNGWKMHYINGAMVYLKRAKAMDAHHPKYRKLIDLYKSLATKFGIRHDI